MGTRASFWVGNPTEVEKREWLGCIAFDGYPSGIDGIEKVATEQDFRDLVLRLSAQTDFARPELGWPFPWDDNIFLTDYTYAYFEGALRATCFHEGFVTIAERLERDSEDEGAERPDSLPDNVPAPSRWNPRQPDSIIVITGVRK